MATVGFGSSGMAIDSYVMPVGGVDRTLIRGLNVWPLKIRTHSTITQ
jgi:hypothetical protein